MSDPTANPAFLRDPYPTYAALRAQCPVQQVPAGSGGRNSYLVTGFEEAREALADSRLSKDTAGFFAGKESRRRLHPAVAHNMLATDPPDHTRLRRLVMNSFTTRAVEELRPFIARTADALLDRWPAEGPVDLVATLAVPLPVIVICELLGVPEPDRAQVRQWSGELFASGAPAVIDAASHSLADYMKGLIAEKRSRPGQALLDRLISARDGDERLSEEELLSLGVLLLVAGHETTTNFLGLAVLALLQHPSEFQRLLRHPAEIASSLDELLRYDSPVSMATFRFTTETVVLGGVEIPADNPVLVAIGAANRDPARWAEPSDLDLDRNAAGHLSFGHGIHRCVGAPLAKAEAEIALQKLLSRFPDMQLAVPVGQLTWRKTRLVRGLAALPVCPVPGR
ncbi:cytochrome P450 family protein [Streptomyces sp. 900105755]